MVKRGLFVGMSLVILIVTLIAQAQDATPDSQATVNAAVSTLIAQTQQAPAMLMTQTIQAALFQALTATAQAPASATTPAAATEQAFDTSTLKLSGTTEVDLIAGPTGAAAYLAPDGEKFAYFKPNTLCIYASDQQQACTDLSDTVKRIDTESVRWSPDSRYLVFTEEFFRTFTEPDIWVFDTTTSKATDITDDGVSKVQLGDADWKNLDLVPHWTQNNQIVFLRYNRISDQIMPPEVHQIALDGSGDQTLGTLNTYDEPFAIYNFDVRGDKLVYAFASQAGSPSDGVWISDLDSQNARQLTVQSKQTILTGVQFSPDGRYALVNAEQKNPAQLPKADVSRAFVVDVSSGEQILIDPDHYVSGAGWSPQGSALVYITHDALDPTNPDAVFVTNAPGTPGQQLDVAQGTYNIGTPRLQQTLGWGANNTILISHSPATGIALIHLE